MPEISSFFGSSIIPLNDEMLSTKSYVSRIWSIWFYDIMMSIDYCPIMFSSIFNI